MSVSFYVLDRPEEQVTQQPSPDNQHWVHLLEINVTWLESLPCTPLRVVQYALYCITHLQGYFHSSASRDPPSRQMTAPVAGSKYYYHYDTQSQTEDGNDRAPSFVPSVVLNDRRVTISSDRASSFRKQVQDRDQKCVISGSGEAFEIAHLIPHFKGNQVRADHCDYHTCLTYCLIMAPDHTGSQ